MAGALLRHVLDDQVEVEVLAVVEALDLAEELRTQLLELLARLGRERAVATQRLLEERVVALFQRPLENATPARLVVGGAEVPLVVPELLRLRDDALLLVLDLAGRLAVLHFDVLVAG